jgi:hypothetical protein
MAFLASMVLLTLLPTTAHAIAQPTQLGDLTMTIYAPEWTWQRERINVLVVINNPTNEERSVDLELELPRRAEDRFTYTGDPSATLHVGPNRSARHVFKDIVALGGVPRGDYAFTVRARTPEAIVGYQFSVKTVRGAAVSSSSLAALVPAALAALWCILIVLALRTYAAPGAWRTSPPPIDSPASAESWIDA